MLGSKKSRGGSSGSTTLISHDTIVVGDVHFCGNLDVEGLVQGNIIAEPKKDALVRVIGKGRVEGEIRSPCVVINGAVKGNVHATQQLELAAKANVEGDVYYALVEMAAGSAVNGSLTHIDSEAQSQADDASAAATAQAAKPDLDSKSKPGAKKKG